MGTGCAQGKLSSRLAWEFASVLFRRMSSGVFEKKLSSIVDGVRTDQALSTPVRYRLYRNAMAREVHVDS